MSWWGKVIGGALGFGLGGPLGAALGAMLGHSFDKGVDQDFEPRINASTQEQIQAAFFSATFASMGHMAKADGRVSENEIANAKAVMDRMGLDATLKKAAIDLFNQGKTTGFDFIGGLTQFNNICGRQRNLKQMFIEIQIGAAFADGQVHPAEMKLLEQMADIFGISHFVLRQLINMVQAQQYFYQKQQQHSGGYQQSYQAQPSANQLQMAYQLLALETSATDAEVKRAYKRLMSQHHPDKLVAKGLPEEMIKAATEKTQEIKAAYETIMKIRGK